MCNKLAALALVALVAIAPKAGPVADIPYFSEDFSAGAPLNDAGKYPLKIWIDDMEVAAGVAGATSVPAPIPIASAENQTHMDFDVAAVATPNSPGDRLYMQADLTFKVRSYDYGPPWGLYNEIHGGAGTFGLFGVGSGFRLTLVMVEENDYQFVLIYQWPVADMLGSRLFTQAELATGSPIRVRVEWQGSSNAGADWMTPAPVADGSVAVIVGGETVIQDSGIALWIGADNKIHPGEYLYFRGGYAADYDNLEVGKAGGAWVDIPNFHAHEWLNASEYPGGAARVLCDLWTTAAGVTMKARLVSLLADDTTIDAVVGTSAEVTATVPTDATFAVVLVGRKQHKLQVRSDPTDTDLWCAPGAKVMI